ncbi:hypothetical protein BU23DRAFT_78691 [Bimuria novae-zelandiae CBS 107.79]|uniref:Uncharacterized protein n=1 Tax=Bimuria novae-zelandiae CBS 107.79 TaxID=1447943 RepID=A0A6A5VPB9_9PLEO|nr:hypothetical protein BU23DRAFT_78691 [Bimuria novae-zelandiae CBS 107.79]
MVPESQYCQTRAIIPETKHLFQSRRYVQCATFCERFLSRHHEVHPVHKAYLHFYFALAHDTMARETTLKHRSAGLDLAEQHYRAAIEILTPSEPYNLDDILSLLSPGSEHSNQPNRFRRLSSISHRSASSSTTSHEPLDRTWERVDSPYDDDGASSQISSFRPDKHRPTPIMTTNAARAYHEEQFSAELFSFLGMVQSHLHSVQQLRTAAPVSWLRSRSSTLSSRPDSRDSSNASEGEPDPLRAGRKSVNFRPRFDPTSIQKLCNEALSEL